MTSEMTGFRHLFKQRGFRFGNEVEGRILRATRQDENRRTQRAECFSRHRHLVSGTLEDENKPPTEDKKSKLSKWKAERELRRKLEQIKKKPAFKVGVVHHKYYSPPVPSKTKRHKEGLISPRPQKISPPRRITRATEKRLAAKLAKARTQNVQRIKSPVIAVETKTRNQSFAPPNHQFKAPAGLTAIPLFGKVRMPSFVDTPRALEIQTPNTEHKSKIFELSTNERRTTKSPFAKIAVVSPMLKSKHESMEEKENVLAKKNVAIMNFQQEKISSSSTSSFEAALALNESMEKFLIALKTQRTTDELTERPLGIQNDEEDELSTVRTLRTRTITAKSTPKSNRRSRQMKDNSYEKEGQGEAEEASSPRMTRSRKTKAKEAQDSPTTPPQTPKLRRSMRKSVTFSGISCTACVEPRIKLPVTPHVRRSQKKRSSRISFFATTEEDVIPFKTGDLISFDSL
ncbi:uncharacterized protein LOC105702548 [Orussus abietinus]|uniref:uncharacterized protein LOC105702548 n=1 Tax=Orussus abietinus TaxID=222816 RepID=UPI000625F91C|nr:uncharacterized protein LOC105702548 [Orussus abietinus]